MANFKDHFSSQAAAYAQYRPRYPEALFAYLAEVAPGRERAWDCATGNGQAALNLARHFAHVVATDASAAQIENATAHPCVVYRVAPAEDCGLDEKAFDLVTVAQALHWLDFNAFYREVRRVLRPGGLLAVWTYEHLRVAQAVDDLVRRYAEGIVGPCWPPERRYVDDGYRTLPFPFEELETPGFELEKTWDLNELLGYLRTWSASQRYRVQHGTDPVALVEQELHTIWGAAEEKRIIRWPLHLRVGRPPAGPSNA